MPSPNQTITAVLLEARRSALLESGLSRIYHHMNDGKDVGMMSGETNDDHSHKRQTDLIKHFRGLGYGPIVARGRTKDWGSESSIIVPGATEAHMKEAGEKFGQQAVIHYNGKTKSATMHNLSASGDKAGTSEKLGAAHFNKKNDLGISVLKGAGFAPKDDTTPTRSFTFKEEVEDNEVILESLWWPPRGMFNPEWTSFVEKDKS